MTFFSCRLLTTPIFPRRLSNFSDLPSDATCDWELLEGENMGMEMKSLKWEEIGTKNLFPALYTTKFMFSVCGPYISRVYGSSSYMKVIGSRSRSHKEEACQSDDSINCELQSINAFAAWRVCISYTRCLVEIIKYLSRSKVKVKGHQSSQ